MPRIAANLNYLFQEHPLLERFAAAAACGFKGVELLVPYAAPAKDLKKRLDEHGLEQVLINTPMGHPEKGDRGLTALPGRTADFHEAFRKAMDYAHVLNCKRIHAVAGVVPPETDRRRCEDAYVNNLAWAAEEAAKDGITVLIEPINGYDIPGFFLNSTKLARHVIDTVAASNLRLQYDLYHSQILEGDLCRTIEREFAIIAHMQVSGTPGRHEPDVGEINCAYVFDFIDRLGYKGWISGEYKPKAGTREGLGWAKPYGIG